MDFLPNRKAKHIGGPSGKVSRIRGNTRRSGDITCMISNEVDPMTIPGVWHMKI